jgi:hypothetical protein
LNGIELGDLLSVGQIVLSDDFPVEQRLALIFVSPLKSIQSKLPLTQLAVKHTIDDEIDNKNTKFARIR